MSVFTNKTITNAGMNLIAQGMAGGSITFKNILLGSGTFTGQDLANQTELVKVENTLPITGVNRNGSTVSLTTTLTPQQIQSDYAWSELGVIAEGETGGEILYLYGHTTQTSIISRNGLDEKIIQVTLLVSNVQNVTATIDSSLVYLTQAELDNHNEGEDSHADIRQELARLNEQMAEIDISWDSVNGKPSTFPPSPHTNHAELDTGIIKGNAITTGNKQLVNHTTDAVYVGNPTIALTLESKDEIRANIGGKVKNLLHNESVINADTVDGKHASDFPLKSQGIGGNAPIWNGSNLNDLPIGVYTTSAIGVPEGGSYHIVMCMYNDVSAGKLQIAMSQGHSGGANDRRGRVYVRSCVQGTWSSWSPMDGASLGYSDARSDGNKQPMWYVTNKRTGMTLELNSGTNNGMPSNHLYHVVTTLPWHDTTGGVIQTATNVDTGQQYIRNRVNDTTWSGWRESGETMGKLYVPSNNVQERLISNELALTGRDNGYFLGKFRAKHNGIIRLNFQMSRNSNVNVELRCGKSLVAGTATTSLGKAYISPPGTTLLSDNPGSSPSIVQCPASNTLYTFDYEVVKDMYFVVFANGTSKNAFTVSRLDVAYDVI